MKILIVAATEVEISELRGVATDSHKLEFLVTGPGMVSTTYELTHFLRENKFDLAVNCGLAGSFVRTIKIGEVVEVNTDTLSELGAEDDEQFLSLAEIGLEGRNDFQSSARTNSNHDFKKVKGITVNTVHGNMASIEKVIKKYKPEIESMEGAAFFYVCEKENIPSIQLRAISNYVERRNKDNWNIPLALQNLKLALEKLLSAL